MVNESASRRDDYARAAMGFVDNHGLTALTMRALGQAMGVDPTAVYRHFPDKNQLIDAMLSLMLEEALSPEVDGDVPPRERIIGTVMRVRHQFQRHPHLAPAFATSTGNIPSGLTLSRQMYTALKELGLKGEELVRCYQMMEGYVLGSCVFDTGVAPDTFVIRQMRYRMYNDPEFDSVARDPKNVERVTNEAFEAAINVLIDYCEQLARQK